MPIASVLLANNYDVDSESPIVVNHLPHIGSEPSSILSGKSLQQTMDIEDFVSWSTKHFLSHNSHQTKCLFFKQKPPTYKNKSFLAQIFTISLSNTKRLPHCPLQSSSSLYSDRLTHPLTFNTFLTAFTIPKYIYNSSTAYKDPLTCHYPTHTPISNPKERNTHP